MKTATQGADSLLSGGKIDTKNKQTNKPKYLFRIYSESEVPQGGLLKIACRIFGQNFWWGKGDEKSFEIYLTLRRQFLLR